MAGREAAILSQIEGLMEEFMASPAGDTPTGAEVGRSLNECIKPALAELRNGDAGQTGQEPTDQPPVQHKSFDDARKQAKADIESSQEDSQESGEEPGETPTTKKKFGSRPY